MAGKRKQNIHSQVKKPNKKTGRFLAFLLKHAMLAGFAFMCAGIIFVVTMNWIILPFYQRSGIDIRTPKVTGKTLKDARKIVMEKHLSIAVDSLAYDDKFPEEIIAFQYPLQGTRVKPNRVIHVTVSKGAKPIHVPSVVGMPRRDAELTIKDAGLAVEGSFMIRSDRARGIVANQNPPGGEEVPGNTGIVLYISNGLPETNVTMPDLVELSLSAAGDTLKAYNFNLDLLDVHYEDAPELLPETVIDQHPDPGTLTNTNSVITLDVSKVD